MKKLVFALAFFFTASLCYAGTKLNPIVKGFFTGPGTETVTLTVQRDSALSSVLLTRIPAGTNTGTIHFITFRANPPTLTTATNIIAESTGTWFETLIAVDDGFLGVQNQEKILFTCTHTGTYYYQITTIQNDKTP